MQQKLRLQARGAAAVERTADGLLRRLCGLGKVAAAGSSGVGGQRRCKDAAVARPEGRRRRGGSCDCRHAENRGGRVGDQAQEIWL
jgi:hypothetical protein